MVFLSRVYRNSSTKHNVLIVNDAYPADLAYIGVDDSKTGYFVIKLRKFTPTKGNTRCQKQTESFVLQLT